MAQIEVEHRGRLTQEKYQELTSFFQKNGEFLGEKKRFTVMLSDRMVKSIREVKDATTDLRVRITNGKAELVLKHGAWGGKDSRKEFGFNFDAEKFEDMIEVLKILGQDKIILQATITLAYKYQDVEYALVKVPGWGYYFEAEILTDEKNREAADKQVEDALKELELAAIDQEEYYELLDSLNGREGFRLDLGKVDFASIKARFSDYFI